MKYDSGFGFGGDYGVLTVPFTLFLLQTARSHHTKIKFTVK